MSAIDPLLNLEIPLVTSTSSTTGSGASKAVEKEVKGKIKSTSSTNLKKSSASSSSKALPTKPGTERVACDLKSIYPAPGIEISFEELKLASLVSYAVDGIERWEFVSEWREEMGRKGG